MSDYYESEEMQDDLDAYTGATQQYADPTGHPDSPDEYAEMDDDDEYAVALANDTLLQTSRKRFNNNEIDEATYNAIKTEHGMDTVTYSKMKNRQFREDTEYKQIQSQQSPDDSYDGSYSAATEFWLGTDPTMAQQYNNAVQMNGLRRSPNPERVSGFWNTLDLTYQQYSGLANLGELNMRSRVRRMSPNTTDLSAEVLTQDVPEEFHALVLKEQATYGDDAAVMLKDNLQNDIRNNAMLEKLPWYTQLGHGVLTAVLDPVTYMAGGVVGAGRAGVTQAAVRLAPNGIKAASKMAPRTATVMSEWTAMSAAESALINGTRLAGGDKTYNLSQYKNDIIAEGVLGGMLGTGIVRGIEITRAQRSKHQAKVDDAVNSVERMQQQVKGDKSAVNDSQLVDSPVPTIRPDYTQQWHKPSKVSDWVLPDERALLAETDQIALAKFRKERADKGVTTVPDADLTTAGIVKKQVQESGGEPRMTAGAMSEHYVQEGLKPVGVPFQLAEAVREGYQNWVPHNNDMKWLRAATLDSMAQLNANNTMLMKVRQGLSESPSSIKNESKDLSHTLDPELVQRAKDIEFDQARLASAWQFKKAINETQMADVVQAIDTLSERTRSLIRDMEETPTSQKEVPADARDIPEEGTGEKDALEVSTERYREELKRSVYDAPAALKEMRIAVVKAQTERSQGVSDNIRNIVSGDGLNATVQEFQNIKGLTANQFTKAQAVINNSPMGRDPAWRRSEFFHQMNRVGTLLREAPTTEARRLMESVALDMAEVAIRYSDGIPKSLNRALNQLKFKPETRYVDNALWELESGTLDKGRVLDDYTSSLLDRGLHPLTKPDGAVRPVSLEELEKTFKVTDGNVDNADWIHLSDNSTFMQQDFSQVQDLIKVNKALEGAPQEVVDKLHFLNSVAVNQSISRAKSVTLPTPVAKFNAVKNGPDDILAVLRAEGITKDMPEWKTRFRELRNQNHVIFQKGNAEVQAEVHAVGQLDHNTPMPDLMPQGYKTNVKRKNPDGAEYVKDLQKQLRNTLQDAGVYDRYWQKKSIAKQQVARIAKVQDALLTNANATVTRMVADGDLTTLGDVVIATNNIRRKNAIAKKNIETRNKMDAATEELKQQKLQDEVVSARGTRNYDELMLRRDTVTKELDDLVTSNSQDMVRMDALRGELALLTDFKGKMESGYTLTPQDRTARLQEVSEPIPEWDGMTPKQQSEVVMDIQQQSMHKINNALDKYAGGEVVVDELSTAPRDWIAALGQAFGRLGGLTEDFATHFQKKNSIALKFLGFRVTEGGKGAGGSVRRNHTGAVIKELEYTKSIAMILPSYAKTMDAYAVRQGHKAVGRLWQQTQAGEHSELVNQFNRDFFTHMNDLRMGRKPKDDDIMSGFVKEWNEYIEHNHKTLTDVGAAGFTKERKVSNYVPQVWKTEVLRQAYADKPDAVVALFEKAYRAAGNEEPGRAARKQMEHLLGMKEGTDQFMPDIDARAKQQLKIDQTTTADGMSILDFLDTEVAGVATKYSNRVGGWTALAKSTDGAISNGMDLNNMRMIIQDETKGDLSALRDYDDLIDMMMGRPTRDGLQPWMRSIKDMTVLTRMGGLGTAQAIETGTVLNRSLLEASADPKYMQKLLKNIAAEDQPKELLEITKLTGYSRDYEWLNRQSVYLDQKEFGKISNAAKLGNSVADLMTGGSLKAPASRLLGKASGYNMVRKYQSMIMQRSFGMSVAKHFHDGSSKMSTRRMADLGLTDHKGNNDVLKQAINDHVVFDADGYPSQYNFDKWDKEALDTFQYSLQRAESQDIIRASVGEMPRWMNSPLMQMAAQFRFVPIVSQNKALARAAAFGDKEAVTGLALNTMTAGLVRAAKIATLAGGYTVIRGSDFEDEFERKWTNAGNDALTGGAVDKYITTVGIFPELNSLAVTGNQAWQNLSEAQNAQEGSAAAADFALGQIPALGLLRDGYKTAEAAVEQDPDNLVKHMQGVTMLGNLGVMELTFEALQEQTKGD